MARNGLLHHPGLAKLANVAYISPSITFLSFHGSSQFENVYGFAAEDYTTHVFQILLFSKSPHRPPSQGLAIHVVLRSSPEGPTYFTGLRRPQSFQIGSDVDHYL